MSAPKNENVLVGLLDQQIGVRGGVLRGDDVTKLPQPSDPRPLVIDDSFEGRGFIDEDGITKTVDFESTEIKEHNGETVRILKTSKKETITFNYLDFYNLENLKDLYGDNNVEETTIGDYTSIIIYEAFKDLPIKPTIIRFLDGDKRITLCIPQAQVSLEDSIEQTFKGEEVIKVPITFNCLPYTITKLDGTQETVSVYMIIDKLSDIPPTPVPVVEHVSPDTVYIGTATTFTLTGSNLDRRDGVGAYVDDTKIADITTATSSWTFVWDGEDGTGEYAEVVIKDSEKTYGTVRITYA